MCRIIVRIKANDHPTDAALTPLRTRLGDIVEVKPDSHVFSLAERTNGQYRIFNLTGVSEESLLDLLESEYDVNDTMTRRRKWTLNAVVISGGGWSGVVNVTEAQLRTVVVAR